MLGSRGALLNYKGCSGVGFGEFGLDAAELGLYHLAHGGKVFLRDGDLCGCLKWDGVAEGTAGEGSHLYAQKLNCGKEHAGHGLVGVCPVEGDVHAGVAALKALHYDREAFVTCRSVVFEVFECGRYIQAACATNAKFAFLL